MAEMAEALIRELFMRSYSLLEIRAVLFKDTGVEMSLRTLKRTLQKLGLRRRGAVDWNTLQAAIMTEIEGSGQRLGCRMMVQRLLGSHGISIGRDRVLRLMHTLDPEGVKMRTRHCLTRRQYHNLGPNFLIHIDGYDKLKRYGLAIHGAICGFSRKVLWLRVNRTNNDPNVVASYFINYIRKISGVPRCIRMDAGTENTTVINMQQALRWFHEDERSGEKSTIIGSSHSNQRIEAWWRHLRQMCIGFWMDFFGDMDDQGLLSTANDLHVECLRFCFNGIIQRELDQIRAEWNTHRVRHSAEHTLEGKPDLLYHYPELFGASDFRYPVAESDIDELELFTTKPPEFGCLDNCAEHFQQLMGNHGKEMPRTCLDAKSLYLWLIQYV